jgi:hypothetical protein
MKNNIVGMQNNKNRILTFIFVIVASVANYAQDTIITEKVEDKIMEKDTNSENLKIIHKDSDTSSFLKKKDAESYKFFHQDEIQSRIRKNLLISGSVIAGVGLLSLGGWLIISMGTIIYVPFMVATPSYEFFDWWGKNSHWFLKIGLSAVVASLPLFIARMVLTGDGEILKRKIKNNYENKFLKNGRTMLNFNVYPNGLGVCLKF